jgi:molybdopterin converting factor small subunit
MKIGIRYYGAFRALGHGTEIEMPAPASIDAVKKELGARFDDKHRLLLEDSALADEARVLRGESIIKGDCTLSVLPPVCGG